MLNLLYIFTPLILILGIAGIFALAKKENERKTSKLNRRDFVIRSSYVWGGIMITIDVIVLVMLIFGNIGQPFPIGFNVALCLAFLVFAFGILQVFREKVRVKDDEIIYTPAIGGSKVYSFSQIEKIESKKTGTVVFIDGKKAFTLDTSGIGTLLFVEIFKTRKHS